MDDPSLEYELPGRSGTRTVRTDEHGCFELRSLFTGTKITVRGLQSGRKSERVLVVPGTTDLVVDGE